MPAGEEQDNAPCFMPEDTASLVPAVASSNHARTSWHHCLLKSTVLTGAAIDLFVQEVCRLLEMLCHHQGLLIACMQGIGQGSIHYLVGQYLLSPAWSSSMRPLLPGSRVICQQTDTEGSEEAEGCGLAPFQVALAKYGELQWPNTVKYSGQMQ